MKKLLIILFLASGFYAKSQSMEGVVTYERTQFWTKILPKLTFLSKEEMDRELRTWGSHDEGWKTKYQLVFNGNQSKFNEVYQESEYGWNSRTSDYLIYRDLDKNRRVEIEDISAKPYLIEDTLSTPSWRVMNKIKEVNGKLCMMAVTQDTIRNQKIVAWFANDIPVSSGPERYFGLPGLIMELDIDDGSVVITAVKVEMKPVAELVELPKKMKGKKINGKQYDNLIHTTLQTAMKGHRYPYMSIRF